MKITSFDSNAVAVKVENVSKRYCLGMIGSRTLSQDLVNWWYKVRGLDNPNFKISNTPNRSANGIGDYIWALRDLDFEVKKGEVFGIIGKNGAGKSTLLKILSRVTGPTVGEMKVKGKIGSLLEVGTGFHPELTGIDNIYLNGAILGMSKLEIRSKLADIIDFSGCRTYIETPVKRYSSGMKVRLGFSVAAFLDPDILVIDEVLAVGDAEFQKKAVGKMKEVSSREGRTVLFVSHNMNSVKSLCNKGMVLESGRITHIGSADSAVDFYLDEMQTLTTKPLHLRMDRVGTGDLVFTSIRFTDGEDKTVDQIISGDRLKIKLKFQTNGTLNYKNLSIRVDFFNHMDIRMVCFLSSEMGNRFDSLNDVDELILDIPNLFLRGGEYQISLIARIGSGKSVVLLDSINHASALSVLPGDLWGVGVPNFVGRLAIFPARFYTVQNTE